MDLFHLQPFHQLCPSISSLNLSCSESNINELKHLIEFKELSEVKISTDSNSPISPEPFMDYLQQLKENKIKKFTFPTFKFKHPIEIVEFYKILFEKTKLTEFECFSSSFTKEESTFLSSWIESNSMLQKISLKCKSTKN
jgi:hypothetical protein